MVPRFPVSENVVQCSLTLDCTENDVMTGRDHLTRPSGDEYLLQCGGVLPREHVPDFQRIRAIQFSNRLSRSCDSARTPHHEESQIVMAAIPRGYRAVEKQTLRRPGGKRRTVTHRRRDENPTVVAVPTYSAVGSVQLGS
jgi:hypothetical protein